MTNDDKITGIIWSHD